MNGEESGFGRLFEQYVFKGAMAVAGISLGINSYFVKEKVSEISADIKAMSLAIRALEVDRAVISQQVTNNTTRLERHHERLMNMETNVSVIAGRLNIEVKK